MSFENIELNWKHVVVSSDATHHILYSSPLYNERYSSVLKFHEPGLAPVRQGSRAWHIRLDGSPAYKRYFNQTFGYYEGLAAVYDNDGWHHITTDGDDLYTERYDWCGNFQEGRCPVRDFNGAYFHIDNTGKTVYNTRWRYAGDYRDGISAVQADNGKSTHINKDGVMIHGRWYLDLDVFHKGFARGCDDRGWMHVDINGEPIYTHRYASVEPFYNGQARVECHNGDFEVINESGKTLVKLRKSK